MNSIQTKLGAGLVLLLSAGMTACEERRRSDTPADAPAEVEARQVGRQLGEATRKVGATVKNAAKGFEEGVGGSGPEATSKPDAGTTEELQPVVLDESEVSLDSIPKSEHTPGQKHR